MDTVYELFRVGRELSVDQIALRTAAIFVISIVLIRMGGLRMFAKKTPFDTIVDIMLGAILSQAIMGISSFLNCIIAVAVLIVLHTVFSWVCTKSPFAARLVKGKAVILFEDGKMADAGLRSFSLTENDLLESLRLNKHRDSLSEVRKVTMESNGRISFVLKNP
ncbi:MAG: DUF421 domain-containing protein [Chitinophagaceae bacterium]|nr:DUF421 domain-containing protein [Chitinophagaceae bacterium]